MSKSETSGPRAFSGWAGGDWAKIVVVLLMGGAIGSGGTIVGNKSNGGGLTRDDVKGQVKESCLYKEDRAVIRGDLARNELALKELSNRVSDLTRSWDETRGRLELVIENQLGPGGGNP